MTPQQEAQTRSLLITIVTATIMLAVALPLIGLSIRLFRWASGW